MSIKEHLMWPFVLEYDSCITALLLYTAAPSYRGSRTFKNAPGAAPAPF